MQILYSFLEFICGKIVIFLLRVNKYFWFIYVFNLGVMFLGGIVSLYIDIFEYDGKVE